MGHSVYLYEQRLEEGVECDLSKDTLPEVSEYNREEHQKTELDTSEGSYRCPSPLGLSPLKWPRRTLTVTTE